MQDSLQIALLIVGAVIGGFIGWKISDWLHRSVIDDYVMSPWELLKRKLSSMAAGVVGGSVIVVLLITTINDKFYGDLKNFKQEKLTDTAVISASEAYNQINTSNSTDNTTPIKDSQQSELSDDKNKDNDREMRSIQPSDNSESTIELKEDNSQNVIDSSNQPQSEHLNISPSFDCNKASNNTEKMICNNSELALLDIKLSEVYRKKQSSTDDKTALKVSQNQWLKVNRNLCKDVECLISSYKKRINELN